MGFRVPFVLVKTQVIIHVIPSGYKYAHQHNHVNVAYEYVLCVGDCVFIPCARERALHGVGGDLFILRTHVGYVYMRANGGLGKLFCWCYIERKSENLDGASGEIIPYAWICMFYVLQIQELVRGARNAVSLAQV